MHPLLDVKRIPSDLEAYLAQVGQVFVVHRGHDSGNTSYGVLVDGTRWFVKSTDNPDALVHLESAIRFHAAVQHPAIVPVVGAFHTPRGRAVVQPWADGEILNDPLAPGALPRGHPDSAHSRFRALPAPEIEAALETILDAHRAIARHGYVAVDFYDGALMYDFKTRTMRLCDLDSYCRGPYVLERERQFGSRRFMAPEEWQRGATIDERTTVFTLGRCILVLLEQPGPAIQQVAERATRADPNERYACVEELYCAWRAAALP